MSFLDKIKDVNEMRKQAKQIELLLAEEKVTGSSGNKISITIDGNMKVLSVQVDESIAGDKSEVARHVRAALEDTFAKHKKALQSRLGHMMQ
jgi:DNA-binding protein YbaB